MRISDWSSDVCSDLPDRRISGRAGAHQQAEGADIVPRRSAGRGQDIAWPLDRPRDGTGVHPPFAGRRDRKSVVWGTSVSVGVDLGGGRIIKKKNSDNTG